VDAVAAGVGAHQHQAVAGAFGPRAHELVGAHEADAHRVDQRVARVAVLEINLAADGRDADAVAVAAYAGDHALDMTRRRRQRPKPKRVEERDRPRAHRDDVADDAPDARGRALVRLDRRWMVVRFDLEDHRPPFANLDGAGVLSRPLDDAGTCRGQTAEQRPRRLVRAVL